MWQILLEKMICVCLPLLWLGELFAAPLLYSASQSAQLLFVLGKDYFWPFAPLYLQVRNTRSWNPTHLWYMKMLLNESLSKTLITQLDFWLVLEVQLQEEVENCSTEENLWFKRKGNLLSKCLKSGCAFGWGCGGLSNQVWKTIPSSLNFLIQPSEMLPYCHWKGQLKNVQ